MVINDNVMYLHTFDQQFILRTYSQLKGNMISIFLAFLPFACCFPDLRNTMLNGNSGNHIQTTGFGQGALNVQMPSGLPSGMPNTQNRKLNKQSNIIPFLNLNCLTFPNVL